MTLEQQAQFKEIRRLLKDAYDDYFDREVGGGGHKSSEMATEVYYPNYWDAVDSSPMQANGIGIYSYVLGPSRMHYFETFDEALVTVRQWHKDQLEHDYSEESGW